RRYGTTMHCDDLKDLVPLHLTGLLDEEEGRALRKHLEGGCPRCAAELAATAAALDEMPYARPPSEPSAMVRARVLARVKKESEPGAGRTILRWRTAGTAIAAAVIAAVLSGLIVGRRDASVIDEL